MRKNTLYRLAAMALAMLLLLASAGCSDAPSSSSEPEVEEPLYPITINGTEIRVGETTVQALLDAGMDITFSEMDSNHQITQYTVDPSEMLEPMSYYSGASIWITDHTFAHVAFVTDEEAIPLGEAVIAYIEISFSSNEEDNAKSIVSLNGVMAKDLTREKAGEMFPDFKGDDNMWFSPASMRNYKYGVYFSSGNLHSLSAERRYDVDWSSGS